MVDLINIDNKLLIGILTPVLLAVGYFYRSRRENIKNRKIALYILLEVWHRISVFYRKDFDDVFDQLAIEIKKQFPAENISENDIRASRNYFTPILIETARGIALSDFDDYQERYQEAVSLISSDDPIFAYKVGSASKTKKFLMFLDSYLARSLSPLEETGVGSKLSQSLKSHMTRSAELESIKDLESDIRKLSLKVSVFAYLSSAHLIKKRKNNISKIDNGELENLVKDILTPALAEFNKSIQPTDKASAD